MQPQARVAETTAAATDEADLVISIEIAEQLEGEVATLVKGTEATWIADEDMEDPSATGTDSGAVVEVFENAEDAKTRSDYIQGVLKDSGGVWGLSTTTCRTMSCYGFRAS